LTCTGMFQRPPSCGLTRPICIRAAANRAENWPKGHLDYLRDHGTDVQLISPRPFQLMQSEKPAKLVQWFAEECNNIIHRQMKLFAGKFLRVCALPQTAGDPIPFPNSSAASNSWVSWDVCLIPIRMKTAARKRLRWAIAIGTRSMRNYAS
jgi:hypothetical protein